MRLFGRGMRKKSLVRSVFDHEFLSSLDKSSCACSQSVQVETPTHKQQRKLTALTASNISSVDNFAESFHGKDDFNEKKLESLKSLRENINWKVKKERNELLGQLYPLISDWIIGLLDSIHTRSTLSLNQ
uniref:Uncharacterized protein n=1 Tax=Trichogramma kaykai TaxID=54128 RepID=A0ABD2W5S6_9HYME